MFDSALPAGGGETSPEDGTDDTARRFRRRAMLSEETALRRNAMGRGCVSGVRDRGPGDWMGAARACTREDRDERKGRPTRDRSEGLIVTTWAL